MQCITIFIINVAGFCHSIYLLVNITHVIIIKIIIIIDSTYVVYFLVDITVHTTILTFRCCSFITCLLFTSVAILFIVRVFATSTILLFMFIFILNCASTVFVLMFISFVICVTSSHFHKVRYLVNCTHPNLRYLGHSFLILP